MIILASGKPWQHPSRQSGTEWHSIASVTHFGSYVTNRHKKKQYLSFSRFINGAYKNGAYK